MGSTVCGGCRPLVPLDPHPMRFLHATLVPLAAVLAAGPAAAQERGMGSSSYAALSPELVGGATQASSPQYSADFALSLGPGASRMSSSSYELELGALPQVEVLSSPGAVVVFGVADGEGTQDGGGSGRLVAFSQGLFLSLAQGLDVGGAPATGVTQVGPLELAFDAPPGVSGLGNSIAQADVELHYVDRSYAAADAYVYLPALLEDGPTSLAGGTMQLSYHGTPGDFVVLMYGFTFAGLGVPIGGFTGSLEILTELTILPGLTLAPDGTAVFPFALPDKPQLAGVTLEFQAAGINNLSPLAGSFTNVAPITFQP